MAPPRRTLTLGALALAASAISLWAWRSRVAAPRPAPAAAIAVAAAPAPPPTTQQQTVVPRGSTFAAALTPFHLGAALISTWVRDARPIFNLGQIQAGKALVLVRAASGAPQALSYQIDASHRLWLRAPASSSPAPAAAWTASIQTIPYQTRLVGVSGSVQSSLFEAVEDAGERDPLALALADIFGWDLDFYTDTRQGDVFRVLVEKRYQDGTFAGYGQIVAAEYVNDGTAYDALRFHDDLGMLAYYRPDGHPMKREFLRSPLKFAARISSGFSRHRFHPILKRYLPHLGIDFAAPTGTPVQTIGAGVVARAGRFGGDGNMVQIRHAGGYQTLYLHLSRILVHTGQRVAQGQRIGLVGMTGLATGPHLDFRIEHGGDFENFEQLRKKLPPAAPVEAKMLPQFDALRARLLPELDKLQPAPAPVAAPAAGH
ncbi:MAG TPA: peptidoglycan DD-metalloendopeptidase family protein [Terriglobales bacterium]|nr:peptidoglycan DD-metalloendopeptidase family protein [Terriglobales bacterium]